MPSHIQEQQIGFYFALNEITCDALERDEDGALIKQLDQIQASAWQNLRDALPTLPEWMIHDEATGGRFCPYELCAKDLETPEVDGMAAFSVSIARDSEIDDPMALKAFKLAAIDAYQKAAEAHGGTARYLSAELYTVQHVTELKRIDV